MEQPKSLEWYLERGITPSRNSPIFDSSDSDIDTYDEHQMKMRKEGKELIKKYFKHQSQKQKEAAEKEKAAAEKAVAKEIKKKKNKTRKKMDIEMTTIKTNQQGGKRKRKRKTRKRKRKRRRKRKTRKKRKVKRRLTKKRR